jgi:D-glycero-alpha-D-manno-heptose-7-phosphate kinase
MKSIYRSRAPLRISFGGGGTEISPYVDLYGGATVSSTIHKYVTTSLTETVSNFELISEENDASIKIQYHELKNLKSLNKNLQISAATIKEFIDHGYLDEYNYLKIVTSSDVPTGSGLGSSSVLTVALIKNLANYLKISLSESQIVKLAFKVERENLGLKGGMQDHFSATFGGLNFIVYHKNKDFELKKLRLDYSTFLEFQASLIFINTGTSRESSQIIEDQQNNMTFNENKEIKTLHEIKKLAFMIRDDIVKGDFKTLGQHINLSWELKKSLSSRVSSNYIDEIYTRALELGAYGGKLSGAGGGGFLFLVVPAEKKNFIANKLNISTERTLSFTNSGAETWKL